MTQRSWVRTPVSVAENPCACCWQHRRPLRSVGFVAKSLIVQLVFIGYPWVSELFALLSSGRRWGGGSVLRDFGRGQDFVICCWCFGVVVLTVCTFSPGHLQLISVGDTDGQYLRSELYRHDRQYIVRDRSINENPIFCFEKSCVWHRRASIYDF